MLHSEEAGRTVPVRDVLGLSARHERGGRCPAAIARFVVSRSGPYRPADPAPWSSTKRKVRRAIRAWRHLSILRTSNGKSDKPYEHFREIRGFVIWLLQYRAYPLWKRLVILGSAVRPASGNGRGRPLHQGPRSSGSIPRRRSRVTCLDERYCTTSRAAGEATGAGPGADRRAHRFRFHASAIPGVLPEIHARHGVDRGIEHGRHREALRGGPSRNTTRRSWASTSTCWSITW